MDRMDCMDRYEVMDLPSASLLGCYESEEEALAVVRSLLEVNDPSWVDDLAIGHERADGSAGEPLYGAALLARLEALPVPTR